RAPAREPARWTEFVAHRDSVLLTGLDAFRGHLVVWAREGGLRQVEVHDLTSGDVYRVRFPEPVYTAGAETNRESDAQPLRLTYQSPVTPPTIYDYNLATRTWHLKKRTEVPHYEASRYAAERLWARAPDGTAVPITLLYRKELVRNGSRPCFLT